MCVEASSSAWNVTRLHSISLISKFYRFLPIMQQARVSAHLQTDLPGTGRLHHACHGCGEAGIVLQDHACLVQGAYILPSFTTCLETILSTCER